VTESILVWLNLQDLIAATKVCREWRAAVSTMRAGTLVLTTMGNVPQQGAIARHITAIIIERDCELQHIIALTRVSPRLTCVAIACNSVQDNEFHIMTDALVQLHHLTHLTLHAWRKKWIPLTPFAAARSLASLIVAIDTFSDISDEHIMEMRSLGHLREFVHRSMTADPDVMRRVLMKPHSLHWHSIGWIYSREYVDPPFTFDKSQKTSNI
jgi:hypothetical protein